MTNVPSTTAASGFQVKSFTDSETGAVYINCWVQIRYISYTPNTSAQVVADIFASQQMIQTMFPVSYNVMPVVDYGSSDWNAYFDLSILQQSDSDIQTESMNYLQAKLGD